MLFTLFKMGKKVCCSPRGLAIAVFIITIALAKCVPSNSKPQPHINLELSQVTKERIEKREKEYEDLYNSTTDKSGLESIRELHMQLDDDKDGSIEPSETGDFIRGDLKYGSDPQQQMRQKKFHRKDSEITVNDLWHTWRKSDVHNWTVDQTVEWLIYNVELPQYVEQFRKHGVNGSRLPQVAVSTSYLGKVIGIDNVIHRSKITLKAMDVVLFGPPKDTSGYFKDVILTTLLVVLVSLLLYAYKQNKKSKEHLKKMLSDLEGLDKAELELKELQSKLQQRDSQLELQQLDSLNAPDDPNEVSRLRAEVEKLENELRRAEVELEDKCWMAPIVLQHWLQMTYEIESAAYLGKKKAAEDQFERAKDMCDKLKKKRSSLVGAFVSTHGKSIDDVDKSILEAKTALLEVTKDLGERTHRWRQIEVLCGCAIMSNPGISVLQNLVRPVGGGRPPANPQGARLNISSKMSNRGSQDDLLNLDDDNHSIAASSTHLTAASSLASARSPLSSSMSMAGGAAVSSISHRAVGAHKTVAKQMSRESSKESSSADEFYAEKSPVLVEVTGLSTKPRGPRIGPGGRKMVKSYSQDASHSMAITAASVIHNLDVAKGNIYPSASDSQLSPVRGTQLTSSTTSSKNMSKDTSLSNSVVVINGNHVEQASNPTISKHQTGDRDDSASDTASIASSSIEVSGSVVEKKKSRRSFFNFRRSKKDHKKELIL